MAEYTLGVAEARFADIIWEHEPVVSGELCRMAQMALGWKKSTAFTVLKRLIDKALFQNEGGLVTARVSREAFYAEQSTRFVEETFCGSLPAFVAAFTSKRPLTAREVEQLWDMIEQYKEGE